MSNTEQPHVHDWFEYSESYTGSGAHAWQCRTCPKTWWGDGKPADIDPVPATSVAVQAQASNEGLTLIARFTAELQAVLKQEKEYPSIDLILHCVRVARNDPEYKFSTTKERGSWKTIAYPYLYGNSVSMPTDRYAK